VYPLAPVRRLLVIMVLGLGGCRNADGPAIDVVRVPPEAYGPFDASAERPIAARDAGPATERAPHNPRCVVTEGGAKHPADPPFDNCEEQLGHRALDVRTTARLRRTEPNACCYLPEPRRGTIHLEDVE